MTTITETRTRLWRTLTVAALLGMVLVHLVGTVAVRGDYPVFALIVEIPLLALALWVATGARWAALAAAIITSLLAVYTAVGAGSRLTDLDRGEMLTAILFFGLGLVAVVAGVATTVQSRRVT
jgi:hypothetical protein